MAWGGRLLTPSQLDRASVQWLESYLLAQKRVTCLIVSHDSGLVVRCCGVIPMCSYLISFLDNVTTDIIHYESKKVCSLLPGQLHGTL